VKTVVGPEDQETVFPEARRLEVKARGQKGLPVDRTIFDQQAPYTEVQEKKCRYGSKHPGKHRCFCGLQLVEVEPASYPVE